MSALSRLWQRTHQFFITGGIMSLGDTIAQKLIENNETFDWPRNARFAVIGLCFVGPTLFNWFRFLDRRIAGQTGLAPLKKMLVDQSFMAPTMNASILILLEVMQRKKWSEIEYKIKHNLPSIVINQYKIWPAVQLVNFYLTPPNYRLLVVNIVALLWNVYLATALQLKHK